MWQSFIFGFFGLCVVSPKYNLCHNLVSPFLYSAAFPQRGNCFAPYTWEYILFPLCSPSFLLCAKDSPAHRTASTFAFLAGSSNSRFAGCVSPGLVQAAWWARSLLCPPEHTPFWPERPGDPVGLNLSSTQFCNFPAVLKLATIPCLFPTYVSEALPIYK